MFGSLMMLASGVLASSPSSARSSGCRRSGGSSSGKAGEDASGQRDVPRLDDDAGGARERLDDRQQRVGGERGRFVGVGVEDLGWS